MAPKHFIYLLSMISLSFSQMDDFSEFEFKDDFFNTEDLYLNFCKKFKKTPHDQRFGHFKKEFDFIKHKNQEIKKNKKKYQVSFN